MPAQDSTTPPVRYQTQLSDPDILAIRLAYAGGRRQRDLAREYGCSQTAISLAVSGKRRRHVEGPTSVRRSPPLPDPAPIS